MAEPAADTTATERADYGDETAPSREHPAVGVLRTVYADIGKAIQHISGGTMQGVWTEVEVDLHQAQAIIANAAGKLKGAA